jgi:hypothetical protein
MGCSVPDRRARRASASRSVRARLRVPATSRWSLLVCLLLVIAAAIAPSALGASEVSAEAVPASAAAATGSRQAVKMAERASRIASRRALKAAERAARHAAQRAKHPFSVSRPNATVTVTCNSVTIEYRGFPDAEGNTVEEIVSVEGEHVVIRTFTFVGTIGLDTFAFQAPGKPKSFHVDVHVKWKTNGFKGGYDIPTRVTCLPEPKFTVQKLQRIGSGPFTSETLAGQVGQTVEYEVLLTNTGNVPLSFGGFEDKRCDEGTIARSSQEEVPPGASMTYTCLHVLTSEDATAKAYANTAIVTGTPPEGSGTAPPPQESNTVVVTPIATPPGEEKHPIEEKHPVEEGKTGVEGIKGSSGGESSEQKTEVRGFITRVPALNGPRGCVRGPFHASVKAAGVATVAFTLDGRKLETLSARNARGGLLSVLIDPRRLRIGPHRIGARITMTGKASATSGPAKANRSLTVVRCSSAVITPHFTG